MTLEKVHAAALNKVLFLPHAVEQMSRIDRMISTDDIRQVIFHGEIIEDYPEDKRGHSCLMFGKDHDGNPVHVVCTPRKDFLVIITAYRPSANEWKQGFKERKKK
ncbi:MAG: DUF4258 domain-containing protein [Bacteroidota bacterium]